MIFYEVSEELYKLEGLFIASIIVMIVIVYAFYVFKAKSKVKKVLGFLIMLSMATSLVWISAFMLYENIYYTQKLKTLSDVKIVSGKIEHFDAYRGNMQKHEKFEVNSVKFRYSPSLYTAGFNSPNKSRGVLSDGVFVDIWHSNYNILKIEIK